jgi:hypothetical protein
MSALVVQGDVHLGEVMIMILELALMEKSRQSSAQLRKKS